MVESPIVISDSSDDDADIKPRKKLQMVPQYGDDVILISSEDEEDCGAVTSFEPPVTKSKTDSTTPLDLEDDDALSLPDIDVTICSKREYEASSSESDLINDRPRKMFKLEEERMSSSSNLVNAVKSNLINCLLVGDIGGVRHPCTLVRGLCYKRHLAEGVAEQTPVHKDTLLSTMMSDHYLKSFAIRALCNRVNTTSYLSQESINTLIEYLFGSDENKEVPGSCEFYLGSSVLFNQLNLHPPCRRGMHLYYTKVSQKWWPHLISKINEIMNCKYTQGTQKEEDRTAVEETNLSEEKFFFDFSDVLRSRKLERKKMYESLSKKDKIERVVTLLKFFVELMKISAMVWFAKKSSMNSDDYGLLRRDISPISSQILWGKDVANFGCINKEIREVFRLFCSSSEEQKLQLCLSGFISINAAIIHRVEKSIYPEMGNLTRAFAKELYYEIKSITCSDNKKKCLSAVQPSWLQFHVSSFFLDVEEPANFYKVKERISQILNTKDIGSSVYEDSVQGSACFIAIRAMMGMMTLKSSKPPSCISNTCLMSEDSIFWFQKMLEDSFILNQINSIQKVLSLPCIQEKNFFIDGFEKELTESQIFQKK